MKLHDTDLIRMQSQKGPDLKSLSERMKDPKSAAHAAKEFEAIFLKQMLDVMAGTLEDGSILGKSPGAGFYQDMFMHEVARQIAERGEIGISKQILSQIEERESGDIPLRGIQDRDRIHTRVPRQKLVTRNIPEPEGNPEPIGGTLASRLNRLSPIISQAAEEYGLDEKLIQAVIAQESYGNPRAVSHAGAKGLMQLMDGTAEGLGVTDSFDPEQNIMGGSRYLRIQLDRYDGDLELALAAYNAGPGAVDRYNGIPPYTETRNYVRKVIDFYHRIGQKEKEHGSPQE